MEIRVMDMFCGISAFRSAAEIIGGFKFIGYCENDPIAIRAYRRLYNTKGEYFCNDARAIRTDEVPDFDLLVGGFPCQPFSAAGEHRAFDDPRGTLFFELTRILEAKRPAFFCFENVPAIRSVWEGWVFTTILGEISRLGYICEWQCIDGSAYLPQSRKRVFFIGYLDTRCAGRILPICRESSKALSELTSNACQGGRVYDPNGSAVTQTSGGGGMGAKTGLYLVDYNRNSKFTDKARCITARQDAGISKRKGEHSAVFFEYNGVYPILTPDREHKRQNGPRYRPKGEKSYCITVADKNGVFINGRIRRLIPKECFRLFGFADEQFDKLQTEEKLSDAKLYKLAGNSIMIPVLVDILSRIKDVNEKYKIND